MKKLLTVLLSAAMIFSFGAIVMAQAEEEAVPDPAFVDAKIVTKVLDEGQIISGVRLEFDSEWTGGALTTSTFAVRGFDVTGLYLNNSGLPGEAEYSGKYVFVNFDDPAGIGTGNNGTLQYNNGQNLLREQTLCVSYVPKQEMFYATGYINIEVDEFLALEITDADGYTTPYRLYVPAIESEEPLPLVIWMHGAGERGDNNLAQIAANRGALNYVTARCQSEHPCYVLAPQAQPTGWDDPAIANIGNIVKGLIEEGNIDASRIYVTGCSMGGMGTKKMMQTYPDMVAAAVVIANSSFLTEPEQLELVKDIPCITICGAADGGGNADANMVENFNLVTGMGYKAVAFLAENGRNGYLRGKEAALDLAPVIEAMEAEGAIWAYVDYLADTVVPNAHWSWMAASENETLQAWMFSQVKASPYQPE